MSNFSDGQISESEEVLFSGFVKNAIDFPDNIAVRHFGKNGKFKNITYGELLVRAVSLSLLMKKYLQSPKENVGVVFPRGIDQITAVLAVQMTGCAYVPVRTSQPAGRVEKIINSSGIHNIIAYEDYSCTYNDVNVIRLSMISENPDLSVRDAAEQIIFPSGGDTAYIIFTSGSTGTPKGVEISHSAALNTINAVNSIFSVTEKDSAINVSSYDFDLSVYDIFGMLRAGGTIVTIDESAAKEPEQWKRIVYEGNVTLWNSVPAIFDMMCTASRNVIPPSLRCILLSGDWVNKKLYFRLGDARKKIRFAALGGATEASVWSNIYEMSDNDEKASWEYVPYGKALPEQKYIIIGSDGEECPVGTQGELWIGGKGLAKGYAGDEKTTAAHFVERNGERWYRTGDAGYIDSSGDIIFCGRLDSQVKINGFRIETGEIESELSRINGIRSAAVIKLEENGKAMLAAAAVPDEKMMPPEDIKNILKDRLPAYMIPELIRYTSAIPLTVNGKYDRKKLELLFSDRRAAAFEPLSTDTEKKLAELWEKVTDNHRIGLNDNFFVLGGDSLKATSLIADIEDRFLITLTLADIFSFPVLKDMAEKIDEAVSEGQAVEFVEGEI